MYNQINNEYYYSTIYKKNILFLGKFLKILLLDNDSNTAGLLSYYIDIEPSWNYCYNDIKKFAQNEIDVLIVDFTNNNFNNFIRDLLETNNKIKTISISDHLESSVKQGCEFCHFNYNRRRLIKPLDPKQLYNLIKNFDQTTCPHYNDFLHLENIIPSIIRRFNCLEYDQNSQIVNIHNRCNANQNTYQIISLLSLLEQNNIDYNILNEYSIKINKSK